MLFSLILNLLVIHIICDFYLQTNSSCNDKILRLHKGRALWIHVMLIGALSWAATWNVNGWWLALLNICIHFAIDCLKSRLQVHYKIFRITGTPKKVIDGTNRRNELYFFVADQLLHLISIAAVSYIWLHCNPDWHQISCIQSILINHPLRLYTFVGILTILKPANIFILEILRAFRLCNQDVDACEGKSTFHAGALIGYTERFLMLIFVVMGQYEALGLLIAAKSILRFTEASSGNVKSEYVLTGTLLSLSASIAIGLLIKWL